jgi:hypothetical protein
MSTLSATLLSFALLAQAASAAAPGRVVSLALPHALEDGESVWVEVKVGVIERGAEIEVETKGGETLGVISPHGIRPGEQAGTYVLPVPPGAVTDGRLTLRLVLSRYGGVGRAPTAKEVRAVRLKVTRPAP